MEVKAPPIRQDGVKNISVWDKMKKNRIVLKKAEITDLTVGVIVYFDGYGEPLRGVVRLNREFHLMPEEKSNGDVLVRYDGQPTSHWTHVSDLWIEA